MASEGMPEADSVLIERDTLTAIMQMLYLAANGRKNIWGNTADELRDFLAAAPNRRAADEGWRPISEAPRQGRILGATPAGYVVIVQWQGFDKKWIDAHSKRWTIVEWMPLPKREKAPPTDRRGGE